MNVLNAMAVQSTENLKAFDTLGIRKPDSDELRRARWCAFAWLEALQYIYLADIGKSIDHEYAEKALAEQLDVLLRDDLAFWLVRHRGFHPKFAKYCEDFRRGKGLRVGYNEEEAVRSWGLEYQTQWLSASGAVLRTTNNNWAYRYAPSNAAPMDPQLTSVVTTNDTNQVSEVDYRYDQYNNVTDKKEYDWGSGARGALLRDTQSFYNTDPKYLDPNVHLVSLFFYAKVYDGSGNQIANWDQEYDENGLQNYASITGHDGGYDFNFVPRGNVTTTRQWLNTTGAFIATQYHYDIVGNVVSKQDPIPGRQPTTYSYADPNNTYAHVTSMTNPLGQTRTATYDYSSGLPTQTTDLNGVPTDYEYNDPLDRLTLVRRAAGRCQHIHYLFLEGEVRRYGGRVKQRGLHHLEEVTICGQVSACVQETAGVVLAQSLGTTCSLSVETMLR